MIDFGQEFRLSPEQVESCISDPKNIGRVQQSQEEGFARGINSTPTFLINDREVHDASYEGMSAEIDALLGAAPPSQAAAPATPPVEAPATPPAQQPAQQ
jgi:hypothetical protein